MKHDTLQKSAHSQLVDREKLSERGEFKLRITSQFHKKQGKEYSQQKNSMHKVSETEKSMGHLSG